ncbi:MAG: zinc metallopeptidase [Dehalococcoidia bacterium]|nr:zinc metallopeptidase [Dehalococcoidia bacterium]
MKTRRGSRSDNVIDRRGASTRGLGGKGLPVGIGAGVGIPGVIIALVLYFISGSGGGGGLGIDSPFGQLPAAPAASDEDVPPTAESDEEAALVEFVSFVLDDLQIFWGDTFEASGQQYRDAKLVLFRDAVQSACGPASSATGPFYCPGDERVYIDLAFYEDLSGRFGAPGDFAQAYVLAHEIGHHVQHVTGISGQVDRKQRSDPDQANELSIRQELQADCLAGVWAHSTYKRDLLESGDLEEGLDAAAAVGDDRIQREATGRVNPETWTHGSSEQRMKWFRTGFDTGDADQCDTFSGDY